MKKIKLKSFLLLVLFFTSIQIYAQTGAFQVRRNSNSDGAIMLGYNDYRYLTFGRSSNPNPNNGAWSIEHWDGGLNFWKPWPTGNSGNYKMFLSDEGFVGINMKPNNAANSNVNAIGNRVSTIGNMRLQITGNTISHGYYIWSDASIKSNQEPLELCLPKILALQPKKYNYKMDVNLGGEIPSNDSNEVKNSTLQNDKLNNNNFNEPKHYGLIAQDVKTQFPNLVAGIGSIEAVNYTELVPILIKGIQEQQTIIESLKQEITDIKGKTVYSDVEKTKLFQNDPNPFRGTTNFTYFIDENVTVTNAIIEVRNIMGVIQSTVTLGDKSGLGKATFDSNGLADGYYIYTLKINGSVKDSKMMLIGD